MLIILACADGNAYAQHLRWSSWTATRATGSGDIEQNDCVPDCAGGQFKTYPATVTLGQVISTPAGPRFSLLTAVFTGVGPNGQKTATYSLPAAPLGS